MNVMGIVRAPSPSLGSSLLGIKKLTQELDIPLTGRRPVGAKPLSSVREKFA